MPALIAILGAGRSLRFGADKLVVLCGGKRLGLWALETALATGLPVVWIAGESAPGFVEGRCAVAKNLAAEQGLSTSLACAAEAADAGGHDALLVMLADMPMVGTRLLARLIEVGPPSASRYADGRPGVPALIPQSAFAALRRLSGNSGAAGMLANLAGLRLVAALPDELVDVDSPADLERVSALVAAKGTLARS